MQCKVKHVTLYTTSLMNKMHSHYCVLNVCFARADFTKVDESKTICEDTGQEQAIASVVMLFVDNYV